MPAISEAKSGKNIAVAIIFFLAPHSINVFDSNGAAVSEENNKNSQANGGFGSRNG
jgi:hypothetical protein